MRFKTILSLLFVSTTALAQGYNYSTNLTDGHSHNFLMALKNLKGKKNLNYLEIGAFEGRTINWMFDFILTHPSSKAVTIDTFTDNTEKILKHNLKTSGHSTKVRILKGRSQEKLRELKPDSFDVIYVDGSHDAADILSDAVQSWELLKVGGILFFDDYGAQGYEIPPKLAIDSFVKVYAKRLEVIHKDYQLHIKKLKH